MAPKEVETPKQEIQELKLNEGEMKALQGLMNPLVEKFNHIEAFKQDIENHRNVLAKLQKENARRFNFERGSKIQSLNEVIKNAENALVEKEEAFENEAERGKRIELGNAFRDIVMKSLVEDEELKNIRATIDKKLTEAYEAYAHHDRLVDEKVNHEYSNFNNDGFYKVFERRLTPLNHGLGNGYTFTRVFVHTLKEFAEKKRNKNEAWN